MDLENLHIYLSMLGILVMIAGSMSAVIKNKYYFSIPILAVLTGVLIGPEMLNLVGPVSIETSAPLMTEAARVTLAISLMGVALRIPQDFLTKNGSRISVYIILLMLLMFATSSLLIYVFIGTGFWMALLLGAVITPTDPVVSSAIVTGGTAKKYIPDKIRHLLSTESGANDGLTIMFFNLPLLMLTAEPGSAWKEWLLTILWDVLIAATAGVILGWLAGKLLKRAERKNWIDKTFLLGYSIAVSMLVLGATRLIDTNAVFAVFAAGVVFSAVINGPVRQKEENVQEAINHFFVIPVFILFGVMLPWQHWAEQHLLFYLVLPAVALLRRLPWIFPVSMITGLSRSKYGKFFTGWFGPIGVAAIFYMSFATTRLQDDIIWNAGSLIIFSSIIIHGLTATPLTDRYRR